jgi:hypothetical protein
VHGPQYEQSFSRSTTAVDIAFFAIHMERVDAAIDEPKDVTSVGFVFAARIQISKGRLGNPLAVGLRVPRTPGCEHAYGTL